jgi:hypothetical protein
VARYRLRLLLQEFDLPPGETILGRSPECQVTIDDPLVSREHAKILVNDEHVVFRDLGSRNGSKVNGQPLRGEVELADGDRLRIGNQELVFTRVTAARRAGRPTGGLRHCRNCQAPYTAEAPICPNCGHVPGAEETLSGEISRRTPINSPDKQQLWSIELQLEVLAKALSLQRVADAERTVARIAAAIDEWIAAGMEIDEQQLEPALEGITSFCNIKGDGQWLRWIFGSLGRLQRLPSAALLAKIGELPAIVTEDAADQLDSTINMWEVRRGELDAAAREILSSMVDLRGRLSSGRMRPGARST